MTALTNTSNSLLAKLLATENITVQHNTSIKTAMFDLKNRVLMLPVWKDISTDLEHLLLGHETAHAIDTPDADTYKAAYETIAKNVFGDEINNTLTKTVSGFLNVIEDARIDKRQKRRYPGIRKNYLIGYKELFDRDFFGTAGRDINGMCFIDRLNIYFKGGNIHLNIEFTPEEKSFLKRVENLETFNETVTLTEEIYRFCKDQIESSLENDLEINFDGSQGDEEGDEYDAYNNANSWDDGDDYDDNDEDADSEIEESSGKSKASGEGDLGDNGSGNPGRGAGSGDDVDNKIPRSETDDAWERKREELVRDSNTNYLYLNLPNIDWAKCVDDYKVVLTDWRASFRHNSWHPSHFNESKFANYRKDFMEWRQKEKETISFLVKEFEQRKSAEIYSRTTIAKTGRIDTNKLHSYKYNDDIFRRLSVIPEGKNHGFVMFLDWSGSMAFGLEHTLKQLLTLVLFCKQIQVPFEVYAFKDHHTDSPFDYEGIDNALILNDFRLRQFLSSKMNVAELNEAMTFLWAMGQGERIASDGMGGTPLNEALILAPKIVNDFRAKYKLEIVNTIVLTDGEANGFNGVKNEVVSDQYRKKQYLYTDKVTRKTYDISPWGWGSDITNTNTLLRILKDQTGCNLIGFFLYTDHWYRFLGRFCQHDTYDHRIKVQKFWRENKYYPVKNVGYDEYYVIDAKALKDNNQELAIDNTKTTKAMAKAFSKFASKKTVNRVLLRNFINHVTGQAKKVA